MDSLFNLFAANAVQGHNRRLRGERHSIIGSINQEQSLLVIGSHDPQTDLAVRESFLHAQISLMLESDVGGVILCPDIYTFDTLYGMYGKEAKMLFFGRNASYQYMRGTTSESVTTGLRELMSAYRESHSDASFSMENVCTLLMKLLGNVTYPELNLLCEGLETGSVSGFMQHAQSVLGPLPEGTDKVLNNHWNTGVPAFLAFRDALELEMNKARAANVPGWSAAQAAYSRKIAVFCTTVQDRMLKTALATELVWLSAYGYAFDLVTFHTPLPEKLMSSLLSTSTAQMRFCAITATLTESALDLSALATRQPAVICIGAVGDDARKLSEFYNTNYRETQVSLTLGHRIFAGFHQGAAPEMPPSVLTAKNIMAGGAVILTADGYTVCDYLFV